MHHAYIDHDVPTNFRDRIPVPYDRDQFMAEFVGDPMSSNYIIFLGNVNNCHWFSVVIDNINRQVPTTRIPIVDLQLRRTRTLKLFFNNFQLCSPFIY